MKKYILALLIIFSALIVNAQQKQQLDTLNIDLDKDFKKDVVIFDKDNAVIIVKLSSQKFKAVKSKQIEFDPFSSGIRVTKSGFEYFNNWMRAGYACQFRYNPTQKQIQLIGMSRYESGSASNDGSGESSVNLLTNNYIGNWHHWDDEKSKLIAMPSIKQKMVLPATYFANFSDDLFFKFQDICVGLYEKAKAKIITESNKPHLTKVKN